MIACWWALSILVFSYSHLYLWFVRLISQVNALLHSLDIDSDLRVKGPVHGRYPELEEYWNESQGTLRSQPPHTADRWVADFSQHGPHGDPESWASSFERQHGANGWASEFEQVTSHPLRLLQCIKIAFCQLLNNQTLAIGSELSWVSLVLGIMNFNIYTYSFLLSTNIAFYNDTYYLLSIFSLSPASCGIKLPLFYFIFYFLYYHQDNSFPQ